MADNTKHCRQRLLTHAFAAAQWGETRRKRKPLPHLTHDDELTFQDDPAFADFVKAHAKIVKKNIVHHDALAYDYSFH